LPSSDQDRTKKGGVKVGRCTSLTSAVAKSNKQQQAHNCSMFVNIVNTLLSLFQYYFMFEDKS